MENAGRARAALAASRLRGTPAASERRSRPPALRVSRGDEIERNLAMIERHWNADLLAKISASPLSWSGSSASSPIRSSGKGHLPGEQGP